MPLFLIYLIACLEGFVTLSIQMIILRLAIPVTGSSIVVTSIFLGVILLALSCGYWYGGKKTEDYRISDQQTGTYTLRLSKLLGGYLIASGIRYLILVVPYQVDILQWTMGYLPYEGALFMVALCLFFVPIFLASQTVPILTELIPIASKGRSAGLIFFISTIGSFLGSILTTILLFPLFGVWKTGVGVSLLLIILGLLSRKPKITSRKEKIGFFLIFVILLLYTLYFSLSTSSSSVLAHYDSAYQEIIVRNYDRKGTAVRIFHTNRSFASGFDPVTKQSPFDYIRSMVETTKILQPKSVLVIGAAGFVYPYEISHFNFVETIDAIDIDPKVKEFAEQYLLQEPLSPKIHFIPQSARYAVRRLVQEGRTYDLIIVDAFLGKSVPAELVTQEFMRDLSKLSVNHHILRNMILDNDLHSDFAQRFLSTAQSVFDSVYTFDVMEREDRAVGTTTNMMVSSFRSATGGILHFSSGKNADQIYTDDKNSAEIDSIVVLK